MSFLITSYLTDRWHRHPSQQSSDCDGRTSLYLGPNLSVILLTTAVDDEENDEEEVVMVVQNRKTAAKANPKLT